MIQVLQHDIDLAKERYQHYLDGNEGHFRSYLFKAIAHADVNNKRRLAQAFPAEVYAVLEYTGRLELLPELIVLKELN